MDEEEFCSYNLTLIERGFSAISTMDGTFLLSRDFFRFLTELFPMMKGKFARIINVKSMRLNIRMTFRVI